MGNYLIKNIKKFINVTGTKSKKITSDDNVTSNSDDDVTSNSDDMVSDDDNFEIPTPDENMIDIIVLSRNSVKKRHKPKYSGPKCPKINIRNNRYRKKFHVCPIHY